jgi:hypothetical protein
MLAWGNAVANEYYEYKLPSDFRRPSDDPGVEKFIRNKYDKKLYVHDNFDYASSIKNHPGGSSSSSVGSKAKPKKVEPAAVNAPVKSIPVVPLKTKSEVRRLAPREVYVFILILHVVRFCNSRQMEF